MKKSKPRNIQIKTEAIVSIWNVVTIRHATFDMIANSRSRIPLANIWLVWFFGHSFASERSHKEQGPDFNA